MFIFYNKISVKQPIKSLNIGHGSVAPFADRDRRHCWRRTMSNLQTWRPGRYFLFLHFLLFSYALVWVCPCKTLIHIIQSVLLYAVESCARILLSRTRNKYFSEYGFEICGALFGQAVSTLTVHCD